MATEKVTSQDKQRFFMFAGLVVVATIGLMFLMSGGDDKADTQKENAAKRKSDEEVLEVQPLIPKGRIVSASWRNGSAPRADHEVV